MVAQLQNLRRAGNFVSDSFLRDECLALGLALLEEQWPVRVFYDGDYREGRTKLYQPALERSFKSRVIVGGSTQELNSGITRFRVTLSHPIPGIEILYPEVSPVIFQALVTAQPCTD
jgi:hypothetical protein